MPSHRVRARPPAGPLTDAALQADPEILQSFLEDAAHYPGGHAQGIAFPRTEADVARLLVAHRRLLAIGAQSSLTGGATPLGEMLIGTARLNDIVRIEQDQARVQAGVPLATLQASLARAGLFYPPAPTYDGAFVGGTVATNAAGAATFKYGATREWVRALTVVLASGDVLDLVRGQTRAAPDGWFEIERSGQVTRVKAPTYRMPDVAKRSAGYYAAPGMDLIDLFIGSEGTLGVITEVTLGVLRQPAAPAVAFVTFPTEREALVVVQALREEAQATWRGGDPSGLDVAAIEHMDRRCLEILREDGQDRKCGVVFPRAAALAILIQLELPPGTDAARAFDEIGDTAGAAGGPLGRFCRILERAGALERAEIALPGDRRRSEQLLALREAVPSGVNHRVGVAKHTIDATIEKTAADMIVPFERFGEMMDIYREGFERRGLDYAVWGHISDGNVHPNVMPRSAADVMAGREAILAFGREVARLGGCPLAEHGVGRNSVKQALLRQLYGDAGIQEMRAVKRVLDPEWKLAPGVIFAERSEKLNAEAAAKT